MADSKEYIEREARYIDIKKVTIPKGFFNQDLNVPKLFDWLESQPAADVAEVRHGHWIEIDEFFECSECGCLTDYRFSNYCPDCGAKMDGKVGDDV